MSTEQYTLRTIDVNRDCEKLVEMWHASDLEWPGSWTQGTVMEAWHIKEWHEREEYLDVFVWDAGDKIAGYCSLIYSQDEDHVIYLPLLNVSPEFQGHSLARKFLTPLCRPYGGIEEDPP